MRNQILPLGNLRGMQVDTYHIVLSNISNLYNNMHHLQQIYITYLMFVNYIISI